MKSCLNHVGFSAGCKRCEALNPAVPTAALEPESVQAEPELVVADDEDSDDD